MRRPSLAAIANFVAVAGSVLFVFWQLHPSLIFSSTTDTGGDTGAHVATANYLMQLVSHGHVTGWDPAWYDGFPLYTYYFIFPDVFAAIAGHVVNFNVAFKICTVLGSLTLPICAWAFGKLTGMKDPRPAVLAAFTLPFLFDQTWSIYGGNIYSTMAGEYSYSLSISFAILFLGLFSRGMRTGKGKIVSSLTLGACILSHVVPAGFAIVGAVIMYVLAGSRDARMWKLRLWWALSVGIVGILLVSFWLVPFQLEGAFSNTMGWQNVTTWRLLFFPGADLWACIVAAVGLLICTWRQERTIAAIMVLGLTMLLGVMFDPFHQLYNVRLLPLYWLCVYLIAGYAVAEVGIMVAAACSWRPSSGEPFPIPFIHKLVTGASPADGLSLAGTSAVPTSVSMSAWANQIAPAGDLFSSFDSTSPSRSDLGTVTAAVVAEDRTVTTEYAAPTEFAAPTSISSPANLPALDEVLSPTALVGAPVSGGAVAAPPAVEAPAVEAPAVEAPATNGTSNGNGHSTLVNGGGSNGNGTGEPPTAKRWGMLPGPKGTPAKPKVTGSIFVPLLGVFLAVLIVLPPLLPNTFKFLDPGTSSEPGWVDWDLSGYQDKTSWPELDSLMTKLAATGATDGCGRVMWEYSQYQGRFGTPMALMTIPMFTNGCMNTQEGLLFESSATTPYHFLDQSELSEGPSDAQNGLDYGPSGSPNVALGIEHLQLLGVQYFLAQTPQVTAQANADPNLTKLWTDGPWPNSTDPANPDTTWTLYSVRDAAMVSPLTNQPEDLSGVNADQNGWLPVAQTWYLNPARWSTEMVSGGPSDWPKVTATSAITAPQGKPLPKITVSDYKTTNESISFHVSKVGVPVLVKTSYFPAWHASGAEGPYRAEPNLMVVVPTSNNVTLTYGATPAGDLGDGLTLIGIVCLVVFAVRRKEDLAGFGTKHDPEESLTVS